MLNLIKFCYILFNLINFYPRRRRGYVIFRVHVLYHFSSQSKLGIQGHFPSNLKFRARARASFRARARPQKKIAFLVHKKKITRFARILHNTCPFARMLAVFMLFVRAFRGRFWSFSVRFAHFVSFFAFFTRF